MHCRGYVLVDPSLTEEAVMQGRLVVGMNIHREICVLGMAGGVAILPEQVRTHRIVHVCVQTMSTSVCVCMCPRSLSERQVQGGL